MNGWRELRVLLVAPDSTGGIGRHVQLLARGLAERGHDVAVVTTAATSERLHLVGEPVQVVPLDVGTGGLGGLRRARKALRRLSTERDVVHAHGLRATVSCVGVRRGAPLVATWHNAPEGSVHHRALHRALEQLAARSATVTLGASPDLVERARRAGSSDARDSHVVAPALPAARTTREQVRAGLGVGDRPLVLAVARLHPQKRLDVLVAALDGWPGDPRTRPLVVVAGEGPARADLERLIASRRVPMRLLGAREDIADLLAASDAVALPSSWEARALVVQEALRAGVPLVASAVGGVPALVGDAGVLVPPGDAAALRTALLDILTDPGLRRRLSDAGPRRAAQWPTSEQSLDQLERIYLDLASRRTV